MQAQEMQLLKVKPMVVPPLPWRSIDSGGLLFTRFRVMRMYCEAQLRMLREADATSPQGMRQVNLTRQEIDLQICLMQETRDDVCLHGGVKDSHRSCSLR